MKLYQSLFLNIISLFGYIDLFFQFASVYSELLVRIFGIGGMVNLLTSLHPIRIPVTVGLLLLTIIEFFIIKIRKYQPIIKINNNIFKILFYITTTISLFYTIFTLYILYKFAY